MSAPYSSQQTLPGLEGDESIEFKTLEEIQRGEIILAPTPGLRTVSGKINFIWSYMQGGQHGTMFHKQIVLTRDAGRGRLRTVMMTSLGKTDIGKTILDRYYDVPEDQRRGVSKDEWMKNIRYFVPVAPTLHEDVSGGQYGQSQLTVTFKNGENPLSYAHWVFVAKKFSVSPLDWPGYEGKGAKISSTFVWPLTRLVEATEQELGEISVPEARVAQTGATEHQISRETPMPGGGPEPQVVKADRRAYEQRSVASTPWTCT
ncbi:uncharacterized protein FOMMEDRAFT_25399 [Fomitiporia mediterranea MF3/22]|uniref:uncharacterized protein n=1 Tax=Fomitiporia mediterranea (strain MF3/22) TaxID=694068 RepID=UPI0004408221|nr:uncharacterized protein FOMMEDRAFT_25399 [Fomitiporia mediterranea MF3/22]EJD08264.1 hypothetical protein FOMMEDRAFT_25399 [Fomitiporia mediterranea MF3/22]